MATLVIVTSTELPSKWVPKDFISWALHDTRSWSYGLTNQRFEELNQFSCLLPNSPASTNSLHHVTVAIVILIIVITCSSSTDIFICGGVGLGAYEGVRKVLHFSWHSGKSRFLLRFLMRGECGALQCRESESQSAAGSNKGGYSSLSSALSFLSIVVWSCSVVYNCFISEAFSCPPFMPCTPF